MTVYTIQSVRATDAIGPFISTIDAVYSTGTFAVGVRDAVGGDGRFSIHTIYGWPLRGLTNWFTRINVWSTLQLLQNGPHHPNLPFSIFHRYTRQESATSCGWRS